MGGVCLLRGPCHVSFTGSHAYITSQISNVTYRSAGIYQIKDPIREKEWKVCVLEWNEEGVCP